MPFSPRPGVATPHRFFSRCRSVDSKAPAVIMRRTEGSLFLFGGVFYGARIGRSYRFAGQAGARAGAGAAPPRRGGAAAAPALHRGPVPVPKGLPCRIEPWVLAGSQTV